MKIVDILGEHHAKYETILGLTKTASLHCLQLSSLPHFPMQFFVKNVHNNYSTY